MFQVKNSARTGASGLRCMVAPSITAITVTEHPAQTDGRLEHGWLQEYDYENNNSSK